METPKSRFTQLDTTAAREVITAIRMLARAEGIFVLASIHQPSIAVLSQFSRLLLLAEGKTCWSGKVSDLDGWFNNWGWPVDKFVS